MTFCKYRGSVAEIVSRMFFEDQKNLLEKSLIVDSLSECYTDRQHQKKCCWKFVIVCFEESVELVKAFEVFLQEKIPK